LPQQIQLPVSGDAKGYQRVADSSVLRTDEDDITSQTQLIKHGPKDKHAPEETPRLEVCRAKPYPMNNKPGS
jgi:hypothetical protein